MRGINEGQRGGGFVCEWKNLNRSKRDLFMGTCRLLWIARRSEGEKINVTGISDVGKRGGGFAS